MIRPLVLVVDDDADILEAICDVLEVEGYRVARARHGAEALEAIDAEVPSLVLLDLMMPVMDGPAFARALRARPSGADVPIVVISADGNPARAVPLGARAYLAKPFDIDAMLSLVALLAGTAREPPQPGA